MLIVRGKLKRPESMNSSREKINRWYTSLWQKNDWLGVHFAVNVGIATVILSIILKTYAGLNPIWAISSMIAASDPTVETAIKSFWARIINASVGCSIGLIFLMIGGENAWKMPLALMITVLLSTYVVKITTMWRQAPITAALVIASELERHSKLTGLELGLRRVGEVMLGCIMGLTISWIMSKIWPPPKKSG